MAKELIREYVEPPKLKRFLRYGLKGEDVKLVQQMLLEQGFFTGTPLGNFLELTKAAVQYFQGTHLDRDGDYLEADGIVGPKTWWAIWNPSGSAQRSFIEPEDISLEDEPRLEMLEYFKKRHAKGIKEVPDGSNYGDGVTPAVNACGFRYGIAWCLAEQSYAEKQVFGEAPLGAMHVHVATFWNEARKWERAFRKGSYTPIPGDLAIFNYKDASRTTLSGSGHVARVAAVSKDGNSFNTYGGNEGNRLKFGTRKVSDRTLVGFVNLFKDENNPPKFKRGISSTPPSTLTLAGTR